VARIVTRGFRGRRQSESDKLPPGQYLTPDFPVLSAGPTPRTPLDSWTFAITDVAGTAREWSWAEFRALAAETVTTDIHCVTRWSKLDTVWTGVSLDVLLDGFETSDGTFAIAYCDGDYTTNLPIGDLVGGKAWVAFEYDGAPLEPEHGGPTRLLVPHLYLWKSAKWVRGLRLQDRDEPGFWESLGYHRRGDPWKEERHWGD
jgi:DMSO/TMAO reductase YedYZ molybdopterin-dependent catalytic subunit